MIALFTIARFGVPRGGRGGRVAAPLVGAVDAVLLPVTHESAGNAAAVVALEAVRRAGNVRAPLPRLVRPVGAVRVAVAGQERGYALPVLALELAAVAPPLRPARGRHAAVRRELVGQVGALGRPVALVGRIHARTVRAAEGARWAPPRRAQLRSFVRVVGAVDDPVAQVDLQHALAIIASPALSVPLWRSI